MGYVTFFDASDGCRFHLRRLPPTTGQARAEVVCLHGIQSHGGWYPDLCQQLADAGYAVSFLDRRGCGLNREHRGDAPSFRRLLDDIAEYARTLTGPRVLLGISWGGKLACAFPYRHPALFAGTCLVTPGLIPRVRVPVGQRLAIMLARFRDPTRLFPIPLNDPELFTGHPAKRLFIANDPLALRLATARLLWESSRLDVQLLWSKRALTGPVLLLLAGRDRIIDTARTRRFAANLRATVEIEEYPHADHTLEFEPSATSYRERIARWIESAVLPARGEPS